MSLRLLRAKDARERRAAVQHATTARWDAAHEESGSARLAAALNGAMVAVTEVSSVSLLASSVM
jgi:hypothetical protein